MDSIDGEFSEYFNADARGARRHKLKRLGRLKKAKNSRLAPQAPQDNTPADLRVILLVIFGFLAALFLVTKLSLGL